MGVLQQHTQGSSSHSEFLAGSREREPALRVFRPRCAPSRTKVY
jgi:hypothetical protein